MGLLIFNIVVIVFLSSKHDWGALIMFLVGIGVGTIHGIGVGVRGLLNGRISDETEEV